MCSLAGDRAIQLSLPHPPSRFPPPLLARPSPAPPSLRLYSLPRPPSPAATRRKSLRLTGSHGITGTRDIYASAPADRSIIRNKEIANLLQDSLPYPSPPLTLDFSTLSARNRPSLFLLLATTAAGDLRPLSFDIVRRGIEGGSRSRELFRLLWVETAMGHPATFQMTGKKSCDTGGERGRRGGV